MTVDEIHGLRDKVTKTQGMTVNMLALWTRIDQLADDVGRLRRIAKPESSLAHLADRLATHVEDLDCVTILTAGELVALGVRVDDALAASDAHRDRLRRKLGYPVTEEQRLARVVLRERQRIAAADRKAA